MRASFVVICSLGLLVLNDPVLARWPTNGVPVYPEGYMQNSGYICSDGKGGAFVVWREERIDHLETESDSYLQHITADGIVDPLWPAGGFPLAIGPSTQNSSYPVVDAQGAIFVAWNDARNNSNDIYAIRVLPGGAPAPGWPAGGVSVCIHPEQQTEPFHGLDGEGGLFILWNDTRDEPNRSRIYWSRLTSTGELAPGWPVDGKPYLGSLDRRSINDILPAAAGGLFALWSDERGATPYGVRRYVTRTLTDGSLAAGWPADGVVVTTSGTTTEIARIISDGQGGVFVGWNENRFGVPNPMFDPYWFDLYAQHVLADGTIDPRWPADGLPVCNTPGAQYVFDMAPDGAGGAFFFWQDRRAEMQVYGQRILADGSVAPGWVAQGKPFSNRLGYKFTPRAVADGQGGFYGIWGLYDEATQRDEIDAQHVRADGTPAPGWPAGGLAVAAATDVSYLSARSVSSDGQGGALLAFERGGDGRHLVMAHRIAHDGPVSTRPALLDAVVSDGEVVVRWQSSDAATLAARVEHQGEGGDWIDAGAPTLEGTDRLVHRARGLAPGRYGFRLRYLDGGTERHTEATWVEVSAAVALRLDGFRPNPAHEGVSVAFALPDDAPASLQLFDARGRLVLGREVGDLGPGSHLVHLDAAGPLPAGLYWVRLVRAERTMHSKGVVVR